MSFLGGVFDDIGSSVSSFFGGSTGATTGTGGSAFDSIISAASGALNSPMETPSSPGGMGQFGPHQLGDQSPQQAGMNRAIQSEDARQLEEQWLARMHRFRLLSLATNVPNYKGGQ